MFKETIKKLPVHRTPGSLDSPVYRTPGEFRLFGTWNYFGLSADQVLRLPGT